MKTLFTLALFVFVGCQAHHSASTFKDAESHWYASIDGNFTVQTPTSLSYRTDTITLKHQDKEFLMELGVHHGQMSPWFFEVLHTDKPAFWSTMSNEEKSWWLKSMAQNRYKPLALFKEDDGRLWGEQQGRQLEVRATESASRLYLVVAAVPPGNLATPPVETFFDSFQINDVAMN
tara:strand:+ start:180 stop:707 length:528 start_codon:yes stop_codon:yes gene_type:complete